MSNIMNIRKQLILSALMFAFAGFSKAGEFRAPSVPLVAHDPYFSIWSPADRLNDCETVHWTGKNQPMHSILRVDGKSYRIMGSQPSYMEPLSQKSVKVYPTRTIYSFQNSNISLELTFTTPALVSRLDILSRPVTYVNWNVKSIDNKEHDVQVYFDCGAEVAVNTVDQAVKWDRPVIEGINAVRLGTVEQKILNRVGDDVRIDWGYAYLAVSKDQKAKVSVAGRQSLIKSFINDGEITDSCDLSQPCAVKGNRISMAASLNLGKVDRKGISSFAMIAYDDIYSIRYFGKDLQAFWKHDGTSMEQLLQKALDDYPGLSAECARFDNELMTDLESVGGRKYADMCALVYRQCLAAHKLVADANGKPLIFCKENFSNGCIATTDVIYPASPFFFLFSKELTKAMLQPVYAYANTERWKFPFAPHDLGTYPHAIGQIYGGGEKSEEDQMPVEETGNMIIMTTALAKMEGNADFAEAYWPVIEKWSKFLLSKGFDPNNQLCTDDFAGHLAHNVNLSAKTIVALGCYSKLCEMTGRKAEAKKVWNKAEGMVKDWVALATEGDHTRLAFDRPGTWSQKYNLVWDRILGLNLFPKEVIQREINYYKNIQSEFGLPLDSRERYTKNDWITWTATMADNIEDFQTLFNPIYHFADKTPQRVPVSDWYITDNAYAVGFQARSVVGGFFIKMLSDKNMWNKWIGKGSDVVGSWAPIVLSNDNKHQ